MKITEWFTTHKTYPSRRGVYNVSCLEERGQSGMWYAYWNGLHFGYFEYTPEAASKNRYRPTAAIARSWRGLA